MNRQTTLVKKEEVKERRWWLIDASGQTLGRLAVRIARLLMGKDKVNYTPHVDVGDCVVVVNASKIRLTGNKAQTKFFQRYSSYPGGLRQYSYQWMLEHRPELLLERAVRRMMPRNKLRAHRMRKLKVYAGPDHPHQAQRPEKLVV